MSVSVCVCVCVSHLVCVCVCVGCATTTAAIGRFGLTARPLPRPANGRHGWGVPTCAAAPPAKSTGASKLGPRVDSVRSNREIKVKSSLLERWDVTKKRILVPIYL